MITIREIRTHDDVLALARLGRANRDECAPSLSFVPEVVIANGDYVIRDIERKILNVWIAWKDGEAIGYAVGNNSPFFYNRDYSAMLNLIYILPEYRKSWAFVKLIKAFEDWARLNGAVRISAGVERTEVDEAKRIRAMFPKMGYNWAGSYYLKEITP